MAKKRVLSGMQASGRLHLGNYLGALKRWVELQEEFECYYFIADWHALSTNYKDTEDIKEYIIDIAVNWIAAGLDPEKSVIFIQSMVSEHAVLHLLLSMIIPVSWLERNPTYKEKIEELKDRELTSYGFLGYPVLQAADILLYKADLVPVGIDQLPHLEMTREIVRRFNHIYGKGLPVIKEPDALLSKITKLPGIDGRKMSKSYNNAIYLSDPPEVVKEKVMIMFTDPQRKRRTDPGDPSICNLYKFHEVYTPLEQRMEIEKGCRSAGIGCTDCKKILITNMLKIMSPFYEKRQEIINNLEWINEILISGSNKAKIEAKETLEEINNAMSLLF